MIISDRARASANGTRTGNVNFAPSSQVLKSRVVLALGYDPLKTGVIENVLTLLTSKEDAANRFGYGSQMHRAMIRLYEASGGAVEVWCLPLSAPATGKATGTATITFANPATSAGSYIFRIAGDEIELDVANGDTVTAQAANLSALINNTPALPVTASAVAGVVTLTSKWLDKTANDITIKVNVLQEEANAAPTGTTVTIVAMTGGSGTSDLTAALAAIQSDDTWYTDLITPYNDTSTLDKVFQFVGIPDDATGLYSSLDYRPLTNWIANVAPASVGFNAVVTLGNARKTDAVNDLVSSPDALELPFEIASYVAGIVSAQAQINPASHYEGLKATYLTGAITKANDWASIYTNRDTALQAGVGFLYKRSGQLVLGDISSFYHPDGERKSGIPV